MLEKLLQQLHIKNSINTKCFKAKNNNTLKQSSLEVALKGMCLKIIEMEVTTNTHLLTNIRFDRVM